MKIGRLYEVMDTVRASIGGARGDVLSVKKIAWHIA